MAAYDWKYVYENLETKLGLVGYPSYTSTEEVDKGGLLPIQDQPRLSRQLEDSLCYRVRTCLKKWKELVNK